jgi:glycosyltransferase involved in cell wall biosynthesis
VRIVYLNPCGQMGGAETSLRELLASVRTAEPAWELYLALGEDGPLAGIARELNVAVTVIPFPRALARIGDSGQGAFKTIWSTVKAAGGATIYARRLARILRGIQPDIIHTNGFKMHLLASWIRPSKTALVWHIHDYVRRRPLMSRMLRRYSKQCAAAIVNSKSVAADLRALCPDLRVVPIYNAVDLSRFAPKGTRLDLDAIAGLPPVAPGAVRVGLVATFARWKGHKIFLEALSRLPADLSVRGYIIGGPIYQTNGSQWSVQELRQEVKRLGLGDRVGFTGFLSDTAAAMRSLDVIVHASTEPEPFGMVIAEGMACGKAVIACQAGGASELFVDGENALAHSPGDVDGLAAQILLLASNEELRRQLGKAGRAVAEQLYSGKRLAQELLAVYRNVRGPSRETPDEPIQIEPESIVRSSSAHAG